MEQLKRQIEALRCSLEIMFEVGNPDKYYDLCNKCKKIMADLGYTDDMLYMQIDTLNEIFEKGAVEQFKLKSNATN